MDTFTMIYRVKNGHVEIVRHDDACVCTECQQRMTPLEARFEQRMQSGLQARSATEVALAHVRAFANSLDASDVSNYYALEALTELEKGYHRILQAQDALVDEYKNGH